MAKRNIRLQADNLAQGISQQIATKRTLNHVEDSLNFLPSILSGNSKRPAMTVTGGVRLTLPPGGAFHHYRRDAAEDYTVVVGIGTIRVFDRHSGREYPVRINTGGSTSNYLQHASGTAQGTFRFLTLADHTFILNTDRVVRMKADTPPKGQPRALVYVQQGDYGMSYAISVNGEEVGRHETNTEDVKETDTARIMWRLTNNLNLSEDEWDVRLNGSVCLISRRDGADFSITASDGLGNKSIRAVKDEVQRFEELPPRAPKGFRVKIAGSVTTDADAYYVRFDTPSTSSDVDCEGVWVECPGPDARLRFDETTMPHILVRQADGTFTFGPASWPNRNAGDETNAPPPSFVGRQLSGLFFFQNRFGLLAGSNAIMSRTGAYFNFWRKSARTDLDSDPVDIAATTSAAITLRYAVPFDRRLMLFSDSAQLVSEGGTTYSPANASLKVTSEYEMDPLTAPVVAGDSIFFAVRRGEYMSFMEMRADANTDRTLAGEITDHCPHLIPAQAYHLVASAAGGMLMAFPKENGGPFYCYSWVWQGREKIVGSWVRMSVPNANIRTASFLENSLYVIATRKGESCMGAMTFSEAGTWHEEQKDVALDFMQAANASVSGGRSILRVEVPLDKPTVLEKDSEGRYHDITRYITNVTLEASGRQRITLEGRHPECLVGDAFLAELVLSKPYAIKYGPRGEMVADLSKRFQLRSLLLSLSHSGSFDALIERPHRDDQSFPFQGGVFDNGSFFLRGANALSGPFKVPLMGRNDELRVTIKAQNWKPLTIIAGEWQGTLMGAQR